MELSEIRKEINDIDDRMRQLFDERIKCSGQVAKVKIEKNDDVFKPIREKEIAERFSGEGEAWYLAYVRKVIQLSRKYQYKLFIDENKEADAFKNISQMSDVFKHGGILNMTMKADPTAVSALSTGDILSIISDTRLTLVELGVDGSSNTVSVKLSIPDTVQAKEEAYILTYMLYKETISFAIY